MFRLFEALDCECWVRTIVVNTDNVVYIYMICIPVVFILVQFLRRLGNEFINDISTIIKNGRWVCCRTISAVCRIRFTSLTAITLGFEEFLVDRPESVVCNDCIEEWSWSSQCELDCLVINSFYTNLVEINVTVNIITQSLYIGSSDPKVGTVEVSKMLSSAVTGA